MFSPPTSATATGWALTRFCVLSWLQSMSSMYGETSGVSGMTLPCTGGGGAWSTGSCTSGMCVVVGGLATELVGTSWGRAVNCIPGGVAAGMMAGGVVSMGLPLGELSLVPEGRRRRGKKSVWYGG